jgi:hypothetical protein
MNDEEIKSEAKRRLETMTEQEKRAMFQLKPEDEEFLSYVEKVGQKSLNPEQSKKFVQLLVTQSARAASGGLQKAGMVHQLNEEFSISKDDLRKGGVKNPYKAKMVKDVAVALAANVAAGALALGGILPGAVAVEATTAVVAADFAAQIKNYHDFKKLQAQYSRGEMDEAEIKSAMMDEVFQESQRRWNH